jgi:SH3-like domain-containing protein
MPSSSALLVSIFLALPLQSATPPSDAAPAAASSPGWFVVTGDDVMLRSGPSVESSYPFGRLAAGSPLKVVERQLGWARVASTGPTYAMLHGLVKADAATNVDAAAGTMTVVGRTAVMAPNITVKGDPDKSWKSLATLVPGDTLEVLGEVQGQRDRYWKVRLPEKAHGWVSLQFLAEATPEQVATIEAAISAGQGIALPSQEAVAEASGSGAAGETTVSDAPAVTVETAVATDGTVAVTEEKFTASDDGVTVTDEKIAVSGPEGKIITETVAVQDATGETVVTETRSETNTAALSAAEARQLAALTYQDLESIWGRVRRDTQESQELDVLRERYLALAVDPSASSSTRNMAASRAEQISMRIEVQNDLRKLEAKRQRLSETQQRAVDYTNANRKRLPFDAVGRLAASSVYNGDRVPLLYRLVDPTSLFTVAYVKPPANTSVTEMLGLIVGVKGTKTYDETLKIDVIAPVAVEALAPDAAAPVQETVKVTDEPAGSAP